MRKIITSVVDALSKDPARKFVYVEQVFFQMWWNDQPDSVKDVVRRLVSGAIVIRMVIVAFTFSPRRSATFCQRRLGYA